MRPAHAADRAETALAWIVVVHPVAELARSRAALVAQAAPGAVVHAASVRHKAIELAGAARGAGAVLVHLRGTDRFTVGWGGHRLIERLVAAGRPVWAWAEPDDVDGRALALASGARGICGPEGFEALRDRRQAVSAAGLASVEPSIAVGVHAERDLEEWFQRRYLRPWEPWVEHASALLVGGGERTDLAERLRVDLSPTTVEQARRRLRELTDAFCGEIRGNESVAAQEALLVLERVARIRPIAAQSSAARSLIRAAALLRADPGIAAEAGLSVTEVDDLLEVAAEELSVGRAPTKRRGRPEAGAWRVRRDLALGRVAERRGQRAAEKLGVLGSLRASVDDTIEAVHDAVADRDRAQWVDH